MPTICSQNYSDHHNCLRYSDIEFLAKDKYTFWSLHSSWRYSLKSNSFNYTYIRNHSIDSERGF